MRRTFVVGVGLTKFERPLTTKKEYFELGKEAGQKALADAGIKYELVEAAVCSYCYGEPTCGQRTVYELGLTGIPIFNVNNNCSSGSSALMLARDLIRGGYQCTLAIGFEKMERGLTIKYSDRESPVQRHFDTVLRLGGTNAPISEHMNSMTTGVINMFSGAATEHSRRYGTTFDQVAMISYKNHKQSINNPHAMIQGEIPLDVIKNKRRLLADFITSPMAAPTADGSAAVLVCSEEFVRAHNLQSTAVEILAQHMSTDTSDSFGTDLANLCGYSMAQRAAQACYDESGYSVNDIDVIELHDCFSSTELLLYEALGLCKPGEAGKLVDEMVWKTNEHGGAYALLGKRWVVNPSGGLESKGHPIGATGLAQCAELCWQLRNAAGKRQVPGAFTALQHNFGLGSACVVTIYKRLLDLQPLPPFPYISKL
ncbi:3-oxoacyl-CoA thiolase-like protein {N-terminal} [Basidiobolus meristosporus CBS 931.73]|uniref:3-oxoacyl-CoA thiolase-like protein (N-terminal) n=1 Tax=Basidiobolus meristosporus CBS 931.73 TaxID=1314790 RepID=A0A1Y1YVT3_9FUNG|nr:3-oxoacyl-CoA thiolase-like protein {N-terminal} [Basidiobolus meristosporus CBS 931.73]|eukprot:ORY02101.1 3-oxoacyl-CoA thiolase-like protein {N-terminal} [Basidiobolus meristosporus CBS 931.73]